ncbi:Clp protease N-terminal domain-containing protein [Nocardiopsis sp. MG754419]|uniref:Clp protease N-terminal domain-containing protein n=1 Tax=Nocardiopsis sp. MG754419 TaxID=2259865 RepID=UPI001BA95C8A|nr:Clp protease N-terminal domain-containing protein [Nocardiopsis sp. MG754419]MBR8745212.1 hypothetical protein [Nocardiopsis sp. MG754419]
MHRHGGGHFYLNATAEALRRGDRKVGTEHVLLALLEDPGGAPARALAEQGVDRDAARAALTTVDERALATVGVRAHMREDALAGRSEDRLPLTPAAKALFRGWRAAAGTESPAPHHLLRALTGHRRPDPAAVLLDALGVDRTALCARLGRP